jgi:hypothetical protein
VTRQIQLAGNLVDGLPSGSGPGDIKYFVSKKEIKEKLVYTLL